MSDLLPESPPAPENGYTVTATMEMTAALWNHILSSIHGRITAREELEATFEGLVETGTSAALTMIQENIAPQLAELQSTLVAALAEIVIITEGIAPNSVLFDSKMPAFYLDPANFTTSSAIKSFMAASDAAAARAALGIGDAVASAISIAIADLVDSAPEALDTLTELATALGNDPEFATTVMAAIGQRLSRDGGTMTGDIDMAGKKVLAADWSDKEAAAADIRSGAAGKWVTPAANHAAMAWVPLTDAATIAVDHRAGINRTVTLGGNHAFGAPENLIPGLPLNILARQDPTGGRVPTWHATYDFGDYGVPLPSLGPDEADLYAFLCITPDKLVFMGIRRRVD